MFTSYSSGHACDGIQLVVHKEGTMTETMKRVLPVLLVLLAAAAFWAAMGPATSQKVVHAIAQAANYQAAAQPPQATPPKQKAASSNKLSGDQIVKETQNMRLNEERTFAVDYGGTNHISFQLRLIGQMNAGSEEFSIQALAGNDETLTILRVK